MIKLSSNDHLFRILDILEETQAPFIIFPANSFEIEKELDCCDCEYVCFHKYKEAPRAVDRVSDLIDFTTSGYPIYKGWYISLTYHS